MMQESKLNSFQQRQLAEKLKAGDSLPTSCHPTSSKKTRQPKEKQQLPKVLNPKNYSGGVRKRDVIEASGAYEKPDYKPRPVVARTDKDKDRLGNIMAYGKDNAPPDPATIKAAREKMWEERLQMLDDEPLDRFDELQKEIEERKSFLDEMMALGQGAKYRSIINTEISQKLREMEVLDKERTAELERMIELQEKSHT